MSSLFKTPNRFSRFVVHMRRRASRLNPFRIFRKRKERRDMFFRSRHKLLESFISKGGHLTPYEKANEISRILDEYSGIDSIDLVAFVLSSKENAETYCPDFLKICLLN